MISRLLCPTLCDPMDYIVCQAPLSMEISQQEHWSGLPFLIPGNLPNPWIKPASLSLLHCQAKFFTTRTTWVALNRAGVKEYWTCNIPWGKRNPESLYKFFLKPNWTCNADSVSQNLKSHIKMRWNEMYTCWNGRRHKFLLNPQLLEVS